MEDSKYIRTNYAKERQIKIIENMMIAHKKISESSSINIKEFCLLSKFILKLLKKIDQDICYFVSENNGNGSNEPP